MSLLTAARATVVIDVDSMDPVVAATHAPAVEKFSDMTSNQAIACFEALRPERSDVLDAAVHAAKAESAEVLDEEHTAVLALDHFTVLLAKSVFPYVTGRVHAQTSPSAAYNTEKTIAHAKRLVAIFEKNGIAKDRVCIKIPATPESLIACQYLEKIGIRTLGTCLFSVSQAIAASQAKCLYIAPYFNELRVHFEPGVWKEYTDTARDHPMSQVIANIVRTYREIGSETLVMPASIVTAAEVGPPLHGRSLRTLMWTSLNRTCP
ncbi:hypothetical protein BC834DRAFT_881702 [Gloeopeniophorella convolvens]|nr:hypothetical protein BC834DRAFT_881702 [Gloeopeniophorella convolvens]